MRVPGTGGREGGGGPVTIQRVVNYGECCAAAGRNVCRLSLPFNLLFFSSLPPPQPDLETERLSQVSPPSSVQEIGLNGDTLPTKATSGAGRPRLSAVKLWIKLISSESDTEPTFLREFYGPK